ALTLVLPMVVAGRLMARFGLGLVLAVAPVITAVGSLWLAAVPTMLVLITFKSLRGATHYSLERPAREVLFTSVDREAKYKSKGFIDTVVYRGSDSVSSWLYTGLDKLGMGTSALSLATIPLAGLWLAVSLWLARLARQPRPSAPAAAPALVSPVDAAR
ncbi:MAG TPA: MFS transporter, partial [Archangium sp.]|nr:MFS transporter [Archangium sp.]